MDAVNRGMGPLGCAESWLKHCFKCGGFPAIPASFFTCFRGVLDYL